MASIGVAVWNASGSHETEERLLLPMNENRKLLSLVRLRTAYLLVCIDPGSDGQIETGMGRITGREGGNVLDAPRGESRV